MMSLLLVTAASVIIGSSFSAWYFQKNDQKFTINGTTLVKPMFQGDITAFGPSSYNLVLDQGSSFLKDDERTDVRFVSTDPDISDIQFGCVLDLSKKEIEVFLQSDFMIELSITVTCSPNIFDYISFDLNSAYTDQGGDISFIEGVKDGVHFSKIKRTIRKTDKEAIYVPDDYDFERYQIPSWADPATYVWFFQSHADSDALGVFYVPGDGKGWEDNLNDTRTALRDDYQPHVCYKSGMKPKTYDEYISMKNALKGAYMHIEFDAAVLNNDGVLWKQQ